MVVRCFGSLALVLGGCAPDGSPDDLGLVANTSLDPVRFEWNDERVHLLRVDPSQGACTCDEGQLAFDTLVEGWSVGVAQDTDF